MKRIGSEKKIGYRIIITNQSFYKEVMLQDIKKHVSLGTDKNCDIRLYKSQFLQEIMIVFYEQDQVWYVSCQKGVYFIQDSIFKEYQKKIRHGDLLIFKYMDLGQFLFQVEVWDESTASHIPYNLKVLFKEEQVIYIGGMQDCHIKLKDPILKNNKITLVKIKDHYLLVGDSTHFGLFVNGKIIKEKVELQDMDFFFLAGYSFCYHNNCLYIASSSPIAVTDSIIIEKIHQESFLTYPNFLQSPRMQDSIVKDPILLLTPSTNPKRPKQHILLKIIPIFFMLFLSLFLKHFFVSSGTRSFLLFSLSSMMLGILTPILHTCFSFFEYRKKRKERKETYLKYISKKEMEVIQLREAERAYLNDCYVSLEQLLERVEKFSSKLFDRSQDDTDFLVIRLGTGEISSNQLITYKQKEEVENYQDLEDELRQSMINFINQYKNLKDVPIIISLVQRKSIGIVGEWNACYEFLKTFMLDLCVHHLPKEVKICYLGYEEESDLFLWLKWIPHIKYNSNQIRMIAYDEESKRQLLDFIYSVYLERMQLKQMKEVVVLFVHDILSFLSHSVSQYKAQLSNCGIYLVFLTEQITWLPKGVTQIVELNSDSYKGSVYSIQNKSKRIDFKYIGLEEKQINQVSLKLAPIVCIEACSTKLLRTEITIFELLQIYTIEDVDLEKNWSTSMVYYSLKVPIGIKKEEEIVYLDLHEKAHGSHGLIAGTTGSGKSELLNTYILAMSVMYHPYDVNFLIIDFKGGGMANHFRDLPHLTGVITNIDGIQVNRSLQSIKAELQIRQEKFSGFGVDHIDSYQKKWRENRTIPPIPHLIIIVDEFAELKAEYPEFMKELIRATRIGRSLGVHLILATQKPAGQISEQIWSNSNFRICLKVQTIEDSKEVIKSPLAASIKESGRGYLQVGNNEIFELFQSAYSRSTIGFEEPQKQVKYQINKIDVAGRRLLFYENKKIERKREETQLEILVTHIMHYCKQKKIPKLPNICLPALSEKIKYQNRRIEQKESRLFVEIGVYDSPQQQLQDAMSLTFDLGHTIIIGSSKSGKTNLLQILLQEFVTFYTPKEVIIYILDFDSIMWRNFETLPHVADVIEEREEEKLVQLWKLLDREIVYRKKYFSNMNCSSFSYFKELYPDIEMPHIVLFVEHFQHGKELYLKEEDSLLKLCQEGLTFGIHVVITNPQVSGLGYRYLACCSNRIAFFCNESSEYQQLFEQSRLGLEQISGRCIIQRKKELYLCQIYQAFEKNEKREQIAEQKAFISNMVLRYPKESKWIIPVMPNVIIKKERFAYKVQENNPYAIFLGLNYENILPQWLLMEQLGVFGLFGATKSGKSNFLIHILEELKERPCKVIIFDDECQKLNQFQNENFTKEYTTDINKIHNILQEFSIILEERQQLDRSEQNEIWKNEVLLVLIIKNKEVYSEIGSKKESISRFQWIISKASKLKVCIICADIENQFVTYITAEVIKIIKNINQFIFFEDLCHIKFLEIPISITRQFKQAISVGDAYYYKDNQCVKIKTVLSNYVYETTMRKDICYDRTNSNYTRYNERTSK